MRYGNHWCCSLKIMDIKHFSTLLLEIWWLNVPSLMEESHTTRSILKVSPLQSVSHSKTDRNTIQDLWCSPLDTQETLLPTLETFFCTRTICSEDSPLVNLTWSKSWMSLTQLKPYQTKIYRAFMSANWTWESTQSTMKGTPNDLHFIVVSNNIYSL